jgi:hypothetical protein
MRAGVIRPSRSLNHGRQRVWNMAQEAKLDEEAIGVAEESLKAHSSKTPSRTTSE